MKPLRKLSLFFLTLCLTVTALISGAAAAQGLRLVVSSREAAATQTVGFSGLPADCQSLQATFALSNQEASYGFVADQDLAGRTGLYVTAKHSGASVTVYVTAKSGVLSDDGSLTLGTISSSDGLSTFTVEQATGLKLIASDNTETTYPSVDTGDSTGGGAGLLPMARMLRADRRMTADTLLELLRTVGGLNREKDVRISSQKDRTKEGSGEKERIYEHLRILFPDV